MNRVNGNHQTVETQREHIRDLGRENNAPLNVHFKPEGIILSRGEDCFFVPNEELLHLNTMLEIYSRTKGRS